MVSCKKKTSPHLKKKDIFFSFNIMHVLFVRFNHLTVFSLGHINHTYFYIKNIILKTIIFFNIVLVAGYIVHVDIAVLSHVKLFFQFRWMQYFSKFLPYSLSNDEKIVSFAPEYMKDIADLLAKTDKRYLQRDCFTYMNILSL